MRMMRSLSAKFKAALERNFTLRQLPAIWRGRETYLQILKNFRELEGSWYGGLKSFLDVFSGGT